MIQIDQFSSLSRADDLDVDAYHQRVRRDLFLPVGSHVETYGEDEEEGIVDVYYIPATDEPPDADWIAGRLPEGDRLTALLTDAFTQYCTPPRCGADEQEAVREYFDDEPEHLQVYESRGYVPFFEITQLCFSRRADALLVSGRFEPDMNLAEHGVDIKFTSDGATFGYACDFDSDFGIE